MSLPDVVTRNTDWNVKVWENKHIPAKLLTKPLSELTLEEWLVIAMLLDGYDTERAHMEPEDLIAAVQTHCRILGIKPDDTVFEFAVGAGAISLVLRLLGIRVDGGVDKAANQIRYASQAMPDLADSLFVGDATEFTAPSDSDHTIAWGLAMYLDRLEDIRLVVAHMMAVTKPGGVVALIEVATAEYEAKEQALRREEQAKFTQPLDHLYPSEEELRTIFVELGLENVFIWRQHVRDYPHNDTRMCIAGWVPKN